jgi:hypothetical protein
MGTRPSSREADKWDPRVSVTALVGYGERNGLHSRMVRVGQEVEFGPELALVFFLFLLFNLISNSNLVLCFTYLNAQTKIHMMQSIYFIIIILFF